jgi:hypothetical protein
MHDSKIGTIPQCINLAHIICKLGHRPELGRLQFPGPFAATLVSPLARRSDHADAEARNWFGFSAPNRSRQMFPDSAPKEKRYYDPERASWIQRRQLRCAGTPRENHLGGRCGPT